MIIRERPGPLELLFALRGSVLLHILPELALIFTLSAAITGWDSMVAPLKHLSSTPFALFGVALSLFLGFRNNAAYDRWWEARRLWGGLLSGVRSLAREAELFLPDTEDRHALLREARAYVHLHRCSLRGLAPDAAALRDAGHLPALTPEAAMTAMNTRLARAFQSGKLDGFGAQILSARLSDMGLAQAGAERIAGTPLPYAYSMLVYRTSWLYCLLLPFALLEGAGWLAPLFTCIVGYTFLGLAEVTEELVHPFGLTENALPLDAICRNCEISLAPHLGEPAPDPLRPVNFRLD